MANILKKLFYIPPPARKNPKIIGLMLAKNEGEKIRFTLAALSRVTDSIVFLDDASQDNSLEIAQSLTDACNIERVVTRDNNDSSYHELANRSQLLEIGRELNGTHFIIMDADEAFTSNGIHDNKLRREILKLRPGDSLALWWIQLWRGTGKYRHGDKSRWDRCTKRMIFCDDGKAAYKPALAHFSLIPEFRKRRRLRIKGPYGLLHFQFVNWPNLMLKQQWYCWLERVETPDKPVQSIHDRYRKSIDESQLQCRDVPPEWFSAYPEFDPSVFESPDLWRREQMNGWIDEYGEAFFDGLDLGDKNMTTGNPAA